VCARVLQVQTAGSLDYCGFRFPRFNCTSWLAERLPGSKEDFAPQS
jgi:hypothetical protein